MVREVPVEVTRVVPREVVEEILATPTTALGPTTRPTTATPRPTRRTTQDPTATSQPTRPPIPPIPPISLAFVTPGPRYLSVEDLIAAGEITGWIARRNGNDVRAIGVFGDGLPNMIRKGGGEFSGNFDWSPDSRHFAYSSRKEHGWGSDLMVLEWPPGTHNKLTSHRSYNWDPAWSPDGRRIAFSSSRDQGAVFLAEYRIFIVNRDGSGLRRVTQSRGGTSDLAPRWSSNGLRIAYHSYVSSISREYGNSDRDPEIWVINTDGSGMRQLTNNTTKDRNPDWEPDGRRIAFQSNRDGNYEIYTINSDGS